MSSSQAVPQGLHFIGWKRYKCSNYRFYLRIEEKKYWISWYLLHNTWCYRDKSEQNCKQECQKQRQRELDPFQNLKKRNFNDYTKKEKPHLDRLEIIRKQAVYQEVRLFPFSALKISIQNNVKQLDIWDVYLLLQSGWMKFGVLI